MAGSIYDDGGQGDEEEPDDPVAAEPDAPAWVPGRAMRAAWPRLLALLAGVAVPLVEIQQAPLHDLARHVAPGLCL